MPNSLHNKERLRQVLFQQSENYQACQKETQRLSLVIFAGVTAAMYVFLYLSGASWIYTLPFLIVLAFIVIRYFTI